MKIYFGTDHAGFELKEQLVPFVRDELGHEVEDLGAHEYNEEDDYPDLIAPVARKVSESALRQAQGEHDLGIVLGGSGQGEAIVANRFPHVRAVVINDAVGSRKEAGEPNEVALSREHNQANVLSLGARFLNNDEAKKVVKDWLETPAESEPRHLRRLQKIEEVTKHLHSN
ncbi:MAG: RpiB/LacA/LacB family sugar-phosphate isomerase [Candidatus Paceibacterota bacterium]